MAEINEAEGIQRKIESNSHFNNKCLSEYDIHKLIENKNNLYDCKNIFYELNNNEKEIIELTLDKKNVEKELNNLKAINKKDLENLKLKFENVEKIYYEENEKILNGMKNNLNNYELKTKYDLESYDKEIENLKKEIKTKEESLKNELDLKKKEELFKLTNEFKLKLVQYINQKKLEKQKKEAEDEIKQRQFESDKAIEFNELRQKAFLVQKIISSIKNISLIS